MGDTQHRGPMWNAGGWFGSQLGGTVWLAISAAVLATRSVAVASTVFGLFLVANFVGIALWRRRSRTSMYSALQILLAAIWACSMAAIFVVDRAGLWETLAIGGRNDWPASWTYVALTVMVVALGLTFHFSHRKRSATSRGDV